MCHINNQLKIKIMNFEQLNALITSLETNKKANKELIEFYVNKRKAILANAFNSAFKTN